MIEQMLQFNVWLISTIILGIVIFSKYVAKQTATVDVLWLIIFGAFFSNINLIPEHHEVLEYIGEWGIVFVMFTLGFDEDIERFKNGLKRSLGIAVIGAIFPFLAGFICAKMFGYSQSVALLWGLTMTATAVSLTMVSLKAKSLHKSQAATGIMTAAVVDDVLSLIGVAIIVPLALTAQKNGGEIVIEWSNIGIIAFKVAIFFTLVLIIGLFAFPERVPKKLNPKSTLLQKIDFYLTKLFLPISIKRFLTLYSGEFTPLIMVFLALGMGAIADIFGFHPAIGAYFAGLFLKKEYFLFEDIKDTIYTQSKFVMDHLAFTIFGPIFFVNLGSKIVFDFSIFAHIWWHILLLFFMVFIFQIASAALAARFTGGYKWHDSVMIGLGMLGRAELAFIVINIAYTENHIFDDAQFQTLIFATFLLNISVPLVINWWKPYYEGKKDLKLFGIKLSA